MKSIKEFGRYHYVPITNDEDNDLVYNVLNKAGKSTIRKYTCYPIGYTGGGTYSGLSYFKGNKDYTEVSVEDFKKWFCEPQEIQYEIY